MEQLAVVASLLVGGAALTMGTFFKQKPVRRSNPNVKILIIDGHDASAAPTVLDAAEKYESEAPAPPKPRSIAKKRVSKAAPEVIVEAVAQPEVLDAVVEPEVAVSVPEVAAAVPEIVNAEEEAPTVQAELVEHKRPLFPFLRYGSMRRELSVAEITPDVAKHSEVGPMHETQAISSDEVAVASQSKVRKLFSGLGRAFVRKGHQEPIEEAHSANTDTFVAQVTSEHGTVAIDSAGALQEIPAEKALPVEEFARADAQHDEHLRAEQERRSQASEADRAAELAVQQEQHRRELERIAAEEQAKEADLVRELARIEAESAACARVEAYAASWWIRLDPDVAEPTEAQRTRLAGTLEVVTAPWAGKLIARALEQDASERVRARLLGALARGGHRAEAVPFETAYTRTEIERWAVIEALSPFESEAPWIADLLHREAAVQVVDDAQAQEEAQQAAHEEDEEAHHPTAQQTSLSLDPVVSPHDAEGSAAEERDDHTVASASPAVQGGVSEQSATRMACS